MKKVKISLPGFQKELEEKDYQKILAAVKKDEFPTCPKECSITSWISYWTRASIRDYKVVVEVKVPLPVDPILVRPETEAWVNEASRRHGKTPGQLMAWLATNMLKLCKDQPSYYTRFIGREDEDGKALPPLHRGDWQPSDHVVTPLPEPVFDPEPEVEEEPLGLLSELY